MHLAIVNGPNLNLLGKREPSVYGSLDFETFYEQLKADHPAIRFDCLQSNIEGELIDAVQRFGFACDGIVLNAGGYTHTSVALADAVAAVPCPVVEVHISNIFAREPERHVSLLSKHCRGMVTGLGLQGYALAVEALALMAGPQKKT